MEGYQPYNASCPENSQTYLKNHAVLVLKCSCFEIFWNRKSDYFESFAIVIAKHFYVEFSFKKLTIVWNIFWILWIFIKLRTAFKLNNFDKTLTLIWKKIFEAFQSSTGEKRVKMDPRVTFLQIFIFGYYMP